MRKAISRACNEICGGAFFGLLLCLSTIISIIKFRNIKKEWSICYVCYQRDRKEM